MRFSNATARWKGIHWSITIASLASIGAISLQNRCIKANDLKAVEIVRRFCQDQKLWWQAEEGHPYTFRCGEEREAEVNPSCGQVVHFWDLEVDKASTKVNLSMDVAYRSFVKSLPKRGVRLAKGMRLIRAVMKHGMVGGFFYHFQWNEFKGDVEFIYESMDALVSATDARITRYDLDCDSLEITNFKPLLSSDEAIRFAKRFSPLQHDQRVEDIHLGVRRDLRYKVKKGEEPPWPPPPPGKQMLTWEVTLRGTYIHPPPPSYPGGKPRKAWASEKRLIVGINAKDGELMGWPLFEELNENDLEAVARLRKFALPSQ